MAGLRVGVEVEATADAIAATAGTLPWMAPERIALGDGRFLVLLSTSFWTSDEACAYAERRIRKSVTGMALGVRVLSTEAFPHVIDLRQPAPPERMSDWHLG